MAVGRPYRFFGAGGGGDIALMAIQVSAFLYRLRAAEGQSMVEYALIITLVAIVVVGAVVLFGQGVSNIFDSITSKL